MSSPELSGALAEASPANGGPAFTIDVFRARNPMSRTKFFELKRLGLGPVITLGRFITPQAEADWRARMERHAMSEAAQIERARRVELAKRAGKAAAASPLHASKHQLGKKRKGSPKKSKRLAGRS